MSRSEETVRQLAYALWEARGCPGGSSQIDWLAAEREVTGREINPAGENSSPNTSDNLTSDNAMSYTAEQQDLQEEGVVNPKDGRGPSRATDDRIGTQVAPPGPKGHSTGSNVI